MKQWIKDTLAYVAGTASILFGGKLLWDPPAALAADPGAVGIALSFITGGFGALGVAITASKVLTNMQDAYERGVRHGRLLFGTSGEVDPGHPDCGHGHIHLETKNKSDIVAEGDNVPEDIVVEAARAVRLWANTNLQEGEEFESVNAMEDPLAPGTGGQRPKGSLVIVEALLRKTGRHSVEAHQRLVDLANLIVDDATCKKFFDKSKAKHWCCWSDH